MRLIDADALMEKIDELRAPKDVPFANSFMWAMAYGWAQGEIAVLTRDAHSVEAVQVVRCRDCKFCRATEDEERIMCMRWEVFKAEDGYCEEGEKSGS